MQLDCVSGIHVCDICLDGLANVGARTLFRLSIIVMIRQINCIVLLRLYFTHAFMGHAWLLHAVGWAQIVRQGIIALTH